MADSASRSEAQSFGVRDGRIVPSDQIGPDSEVFDAKGRVVMPGFVDCHTHALYAGDRLAEHKMKLAGASYAEIARAGGGILATVQAVRAASVQQLVDETVPRIGTLAAEGVTTLEIKSGYGLTVDDELKMLRAIAMLSSQNTLRIVPTFLGAHAVPPEQTRSDYMDEVINVMLPAVAEQKLADTVDIYVESIAFDLADMQHFFDAARDQGFKLRAHTEQLSNMGGTALACRYDALSCDHLEFADDETAKRMARSGTIAVLLPGAYYFLREERKPPVEALRKHAVPMAVATDLNPGSSPLPSLLTALHMSTILFGLTVEEALLAVTRNAARALGLEHEIGTLESGKRADFTVWNIPSAEMLTYQLGGMRPDCVFIGGQRQ